MGFDLQIREATVDDAEAISKVLFAAFSKLAPEYTPEAFAAVTPPPDEIVRRLDEGPMWVAISGDEALGTVSVVPEPEWLYIRSMAVSPTAQGSGIGGKLLRSTERYAIENGFDRLFLYTTWFLSGAIRLYEKNGFIRGRETTAEEWFGVPGLAMEKRLDRKYQIKCYLKLKTYMPASTAKKF